MIFERFKYLAKDGGSCNNKLQLEMTWAWVNPVSIN